MFLTSSYSIDYIGFEFFLICCSIVTGHSIIKFARRPHQKCKFRGYSPAFLTVVRVWITCKMHPASLDPQ
jgi:hypothetical protein